MSGWTEGQRQRVLAFLLELTGGRPLDELRREADSCRDSADLDISWQASVAADAGELLAELDTD